MEKRDFVEESEGSEDPRLSSLDARLRQVQRAEKNRTERSPIGVGMTGKGASQGNRVISILFGFPFGAALIGWVADKLLETSPAIMLSMLFLGFGAAGYQVYRISKERAE